QRDVAGEVAVVRVSGALESDLSGLDAHLPKNTGDLVPQPFDRHQSAFGFEGEADFDSELVEELPLSLDPDDLPESPPDVPPVFPSLFPEPPPSEPAAFL